MTPGNNAMVRSFRALSLLVPFTVAILGTASHSSSPAVDVAAEESAVRQLTLDWVAAEASNDVGSALRFMWEDAVMQPPNAPQIQGHEAIRALYGTVTFVSLAVGQTTVKVSASGDLAAVWGPLTVVVQAPDGPITNQAKFVAVWERRNGEWKVLENSWSSDLPAPAAG